MGSRKRSYDEETVNAIDVLEKLAKKADEEWVIIRSIVLSYSLASEGYIFVTENGLGEFYILVNQKDWDRAKSELIMSGEKDADFIIEACLMGIPVTDDEKTAQKASSGVYKWTYKLQ